MLFGRRIHFMYHTLRKFGYLLRDVYFPLELCPKTWILKNLPRRVDSRNALSTVLDKGGRLV